jgi:hypothetical protein
MTQTSTDPEGAPPIVDPSPAQPPIQLGNADYVFPPAKESPPEVLELEPNRWEDATTGPDPQISQTMYVHMIKPDGSDFIVPLANVPDYERKGYTKGAEEDIPDLVAYQANRARQTA